jgi:hypothetical protein
MPGACSAQPGCGASIGSSVDGEVNEAMHAPVAASSTAALTDELPISNPNVFIFSCFMPNAA